MDVNAVRLSKSVVNVQEILLYVRDDRYFGKRPAADYLGLSVRWLEAHLEEIPHYRLPSGHVRFRRSELDDWMQQHRVADQLDVSAVVDDVVGAIRGKGA